MYGKYLNRFWRTWVYRLIFTLILVTVAPEPVHAERWHGRLLATWRHVVSRTRSLPEKVKWYTTYRVPTAEVDWGDGVIRATGHGTLPPAAQSYPQAKLMAIGAAQLDAERAIAATLHGALIRSRRKLDQYIQIQYLVEERVQALVKGARIAGVHVEPDGNVAVNMELVLKRPEAEEPPAASVAPALETARVVQELQPEQPEPQPELIPSRLQGWRQQDYYIPTQGRLGRGKECTGLIVNARNLHLRPAICPKVLDEEGNQLYPEADHPVLARILKGKTIPVTYMPSVAAALSSPRIGDNPLVIDAVATAGESNTDIVIGRKDLKKLAKVANSGKLFENGHVMVVVD